MIIDCRQVMLFWTERKVRPGDRIVAPEQNDGVVVALEGSAVHVSYGWAGGDLAHKEAPRWLVVTVGEDSSEAAGLESDPSL